MKRRTLKHGEKALWDKVVRTIAPLHASGVPVPIAAAPPAIAGASPRATAQPPAKDAVAASGSVAPAYVVGGATALTPAPVAAQPAKPRAAGDLDRKMRRKLARGAVTIDGRIDLHGMTQEEAHLALLRFIDVSVGERRRVVLVITGKGVSGGSRGSDHRGVLRRSVPHWLTGRELARYVVSFGPAHQTHGGDGAIYVRLRSGH